MGMDSIDCSTFYYTQKPTETMHHIGRAEFSEHLPPPVAVRDGAALRIALLFTRDCRTVLVSGVVVLQTETVY